MGQQYVRGGRRGEEKEQEELEDRRGGGLRDPATLPLLDSRGEAGRFGLGGEELKEEEREDVEAGHRCRGMGSSRGEDSSNAGGGGGAQGNGGAGNKPTSAGLKAAGEAAKACVLNGRVQRSVLLVLGVAVLLFQFLSDHVYIWMVRDDATHHPAANMHAILLHCRVMSLGIAWSCLTCVSTSGGGVLLLR